MTATEVASPRRIAARSWWADMAHGSIYVVAAIGVAFFLADGGLQTFTTVDYVYSTGRVLGIVAAANGAALHVVLGARGDGWSSTEHPATLESLVPDVAERDVYICGPGRWPATVEKEARAAGVARDSVHRETFAWSGDKR